MSTFSALFKDDSLSINISSIHRLKIKIEAQFLTDAKYFELLKGESSFLPLVILSHGPKILAKFTNSSLSFDAIRNDLMKNDTSIILPDSDFKKSFKIVELNLGKLIYYIDDSEGGLNYVYFVFSELDSTLALKYSTYIEFDLHKSVLELN